MGLTDLDLADFGFVDLGSADFAMGRQLLRLYERPVQPFITGSDSPFSLRILSHPLPSSPIGSGGLMFTLAFFSVASPRWTFSANLRTSVNSASRIWSSV